MTKKYLKLHLRPDDKSDSTFRATPYRQELVEDLPFSRELI